MKWEEGPKGESNRSSWNRNNWKSRERSQILPTEYLVSLPKCNKYKYHHQGNCRELVCNSYSRKEHTPKSYRKNKANREILEANYLRGIM